MSKNKILSVNHISQITLVLISDKVPLFGPYFKTQVLGSFLDSALMKIT